jgi:Na+-transporting methylmalonyl-CoA/oxaloacetate decarboxylase gamma subunit
MESLVFIALVILAVAAIFVFAVIMSIAASRSADQSWPTAVPDAEPSAAVPMPVSAARTT